MGTFLVGFSFLPDPAYDNSLPDLPASIMIDNRTVDVRLNLEDPEGRLRGAVGGVGPFGLDVLTVCYILLLVAIFATNIYTSNKARSA